MNTRLENLILSGLVAAAISVSVSSADVLPNPGGSPSLADKVTALQKRVDTLQRREAADHANINHVANAAADAQATADCIIGGNPFLVWSKAGDTGQTDLYAVGDENDPDVQWLATIDPACLA